MALEQEFDHLGDPTKLQAWISLENLRDSFRDTIYPARANLNKSARKNRRKAQNPSVPGWYWHIQQDVVVEAVNTAKTPHNHLFTGRSLFWTLRWELTVSSFKNLVFVFFGG